MSQGLALLLLFVVMPIVLGVAVAALVQWRSSPVAADELTSEVLRTGEPAQATVLDWRSPGQSFVDRRPMVTFRVALLDGGDQLHITQSVPRIVLRRMQKGMTVDVRLGPDRASGAIVLPEESEQSPGR